MHPPYTIEDAAAAVDFDLTSIKTVLTLAKASPHACDQKLCKCESVPATTLATTRCKLANQRHMGVT